jgi:glyoxylase-like metal-dependent hydrolase (beta-lactamase superfamily II)
VTSSGAVIVERTENPSWLSNAYLFAEGPGGSGVLVDCNDVADPLFERIDGDGIKVTHILLTHHHADHIAGLAEVRERAGSPPVLAHELTAAEILDPVDETLADGDTIRSGELDVKAIHTPGHDAGHLALLVGDGDCVTADLIFKGTVGGTMAPGATGFADLRRSIMERVLTLPPETVLHPGHREPTTVAEEWESNPFVRVWRGLDEEGAERCSVWGRDATLVVWGPDYDGGNKAWVRFDDDGADAIVGGSQVER